MPTHLDPPPENPPSPFDEWGQGTTDDEEPETFERPADPEPPVGDSGYGDQFEPGDPNDPQNYFGGE